MKPVTKRIVWIIAVALFIGGFLLFLGLWYSGKQQANEGGVSGTVTTSSVPADSTTIPTGQANSIAIGSRSPLADIGTFFGTLANWFSHGNNNNGSYTGGYPQNSYPGGQYSYPVYSGNTPTSTPPGNISTTTPPGGVGSACTPGSCSCDSNGVQSCTTGVQNKDGSCQVNTLTCTQGSSCVECYGGGGPGTTTPIGSVWIPGGGAPFNPTPINGVSSSSPTGSGNIFNPVTGGNLPGGKGSTLTGSLLGIGIAAAGCYGIVEAEKTQETLTKAAIKGEIALITAKEKVSDTGAVPVAPLSLELPTNTLLQQIGELQSQLNNNQLETFTKCMTQAIARVVLDKITASTVNWIDSGFNGSPTFVQDYQQFFSDVANQTAGAYLQSSNFAFLCSPFSLQVKIAVAESYAATQNATPTSANSCTLNQVTNNLDGFLHGDFTSGGWPALLSFTNSPENNPFGSYINLSAGLQSSISKANQTAQESISPEGFLSTHQVVCENGTAPPPSTTASSNVGTVCPANLPPGCRCIITTPGSTIAHSLDKTLGIPYDQLNAAQDIDQIISALMNQLIQTAFQGGVSNLSGAQVPSSGENQGSSLAQQLLTDMENDTNTAQQYGYTEQGAISDIQNAQSQLQTLANCWNSAATSTVFSATQQAQAAVNASSTEAQISTLQQQVDADNNQITTANSAIALLQQLQSQILNASSLSDVQSAQSLYTADQANGSLITDTDLTTAQQDRTTLQSQLSTINQNTSTQLQQCYAFGTQTTQ